MGTLKEPEVGTHIRWMIRRDMPEVLRLEGICFEFPWSEDDFLKCLRQRNCIGMVAERDDKIVGFMIYELHPNRLGIENLAVAPSVHRTGVGRSMVEKLTGELSERRSSIMVVVRDKNLEGQLFFKNMGFRAVSVLRDYYEDAPDEGYLFQYRREWQ